MKIFRDPVHNVIDLDTGNIKVNKLIISLIDSPEFQRLRFVKQLGFIYFSYMSANHTRFEHSLGVAYLAKRFLEKLISLKEKIVADYEQAGTRANKEIILEFLNELKEKKPAIIVAALLHDIGHGPFSHVFEEITGIDHENWTEKIVCGRTKINELLTGYSPDFPIEICNLIKGSSGSLSATSLLSGQLDVDRIDYLLRDSYMTGVGYGQFDVEWMVNVLSVGINEGKVDIGFDLGKGLSVAEDFVIARINMFKNVYRHKSNIAAQKMLILLLKRAKEIISQGKELVSLTPELRLMLLMKNNQSDVLSDFLRLTDYHLYAIIDCWQDSEDRIISNLSRGLIQRKLFKRVDPDDWDGVRNYLYENVGKDFQHYYSVTIQTTTKNEKLIYRPKNGPILLFDRSGEGHELTEKSRIIPTVLSKEDMPTEYYADSELYASFISKQK